MRLAALLGCALLALPRLAAAERDNDEQDIPQPASDPQASLIWADGAYLMSFYQAEKLVDPMWVLRKLRLLPWREAVNVTPLGEVLDSSWYTNRHGRSRMTQEELRRGPGGEPPKLPFTVLEASPHAENVRFVAKDATGRRFFIKLDPHGRPGLATNGETIVSRLLHAAGYNVPSYFRIWLEPGHLTMAPGARMQGRYREVWKPMKPGDERVLFALAAESPPGSFSAVASLALPGKPIGPFSYYGTRRDDPNDTVRHEDRRELRAYQVFCAWVNNTDSRQGNTLDLYVEEDGRRFVRHYLLDFSASFGSGNNEFKRPDEGIDYYLDLWQVLRSAAALGARVRPWERRELEGYAELGPYRSQGFHPRAWKPSYANPAFERLTAGDGLWGARLVTSFTDADLEAAVESGYFPSPGAREHLLKTLGERRDAIGRYWLGSPVVAPLEAFAVVGSSLTFVDLGIERGYAQPDSTLYRWGGRIASEPAFALTTGFQGRIDIRVSRDLGRKWGRPVKVRVSGRRVLAVDR